MSTISDNSIMSALGRQMTQAVARETAAASNLANLDTPGYHARAATFNDALQAQLSAATLTVTAPGHISNAAQIAHGNITEVPGLEERRDGNNVQLDRELLGLTEASTDFSSAQAALSAKFRAVRYAINDGR